MAALMILATACKDKKEQFEINGRIAEADGKTLYFEAVTLNGIEALDSIRLDENGDFRFHGMRPFNPEFYRLRIDRQIVNLSVDSTDTWKPRGPPWAPAMRWKAHPTAKP